MSETNTPPVGASLTPAEQAALARAERAHSPTNPQETPPITQPVGPKKFAGRYDSAEDLEKGYKELQAEYSRLKSGKPAEPTKEEQPPAQPNDSAKIEKPAETDAEKALSQVGLDFAEFSASYETNGGKLTDADYAKLESKGIPKAIVDTHIQGLQLIAQNAFNTAVAHVGGAEQFNAMRNWAASTLTDAELSAYNTSVSAGGESMKLALTGLKARFAEASKSTEPRLIVGQVAGSGGGDTFASLKELSQAQRDPRYKTDQAYRREVTEKLSRSKL